MGDIKILIVLYLLAVNIYGYVVIAIDKRKAIKHQWRIRERHLWLSAWLGGAFGVYIGMQHKRHKTKHLSFRIGVPLLCLGHLLLWVWIFIEIWK